MSPAQLLAHFDRVCEAPGAVPRLRRFILDLAVRGKLVEQDPGDEPAAELLRRIEAAKALLAEKGTIKRKMTQSPEALVRTSLPLPSGWLLATLGSLALKITDGTHKTPTYREAGIPFISVKDFSGGKLDFAQTRFISADEHALLFQRCDPRRGDILIGRIGTLGKAVLVDTDREFSLFVSVGLIRFDHTFLNPEFVRLLLNSPHTESEFDRIKIGGATHTNKLNLGDLHDVVLPLPPVSEQQRIVAKVDELMALCDRLEAAQAERERRRDRLVAASLKRLNEPASAGEAREHVRFHLRHLPRMTTRREHVKELRQTILSLAVRGRLVSRATRHEPQHLAGVLATEADGPFEIPSTWVWRRLDAIGDARLGKMLDKAKNRGTPKRYLRNVNVRWFDFDLSDLREMRFEEDELEGFSLRRGDVLICEGGEPGRAAVWDEREANIYFQKAIHRVRPFDSFDQHFLVMVIRQSFDSGRLAAYYTGVGIKHLT